MLAPLPKLYRDLVVVVVLIIGVVSGIWVTQVTSLSAVAGAGALFGALAGLVAAYVVVHDFSKRAHGARIARHR